MDNHEILESSVNSRRELIKNLSLLPVLGVAFLGIDKKRGWFCFEEEKIVPFPHVLRPEGMPTKVRAYYFGNSLTGVTMPQWQAELGRSESRTWENHAWLGAGWQLWQHRETLAAGRDLFGAGSKGNLTLDNDLIHSANEHVKAFANEYWDTVVLQLFAPYLSKVTEKKENGKLSGTKDLGDLASAADLITLQLRHNPQSRVFIYQVWPAMEKGQPRDGMRGAEFPLRESFNYEQSWLQKYDPAVKDPGVSLANRTRDLSQKVFTGLQQRFPTLWAEGRLRIIPGGDLFLELDKKFRAGAAPGIADIRDFYTDIQHVRAGLPRYTLAALMFACLFGTRPNKLDWRLYNDAAKYGPDPHHDSGELLTITKERAKVVNDLIWQVVTTHPFMNSKK